MSPTFAAAALLAAILVAPVPSAPAPHHDYADDLLALSCSQTEAAIKALRDSGAPVELLVDPSTGEVVAALAPRANALERFSRP